MDMTGEQLIAAPKAKVWAALNDPEILRQAIPGCESIAKESDTTMVATVVAKVGPVKATFKGKVTLSDIDPPNSYTITGEGAGGAAGFGKGGAKVQLEDAPGGTLLKYKAEAQVGGKLAQLGSRLIDATSRKLAEDFFVKFNEIVGAAEAAAQTGAPAAASGAEAAPGAAPATPAAAPGTGKGIPSWIWVGGLILAAMLAMWLVSGK